MSWVQIPLPLMVKILQIFFSSLLILSSLCVVILNNSIYSVLFLIIGFISASSILIILQCEFIALIFVIIYVGAIAVLFLFVVMMLDSKSSIFFKDYLKYAPVGIFISLVFLTQLFNIILYNFETNPYSTNNFIYNFYFNWFSKIDFLHEIEVIGQLVYTFYVLQFLISGFLLLIATIGSVVLTLDLNQHQLYVKKQFSFKQLSRNYKNALVFY